MLKRIGCAAMLVMTAASISLFASADDFTVKNAGTNAAICAGSIADGNFAAHPQTKVTTSEFIRGEVIEDAECRWMWDGGYLVDGAINTGRYGDGVPVDRPQIGPNGDYVSNGWLLRNGWHSAIEKHNERSDAQNQKVWIQFEFPEAYDIGRLNLWPRSWANDPQDAIASQRYTRSGRIFFPQEFKVYTSMDGTSWTEVLHQDYGAREFIPQPGVYFAGRNEGKEYKNRPILQAYELKATKAKFLKIDVIRKQVDNQRTWHELPNNGQEFVYESAVALAEIEVYAPNKISVPAGTTTTKAKTTTKSSGKTTTKTGDSTSPTGETTAETHDQTDNTADTTITGGAAHMAATETTATGGSGGENIGLIIVLAAGGVVVVAGGATGVGILLKKKGII